MAELADTDPMNLIDRVFELLGAAEDTELLEEIRDSQATASSAWTESPPWVLCIEDDEHFSLALKLKLEQHGVAVVRAAEGVEGLNQAITRPADAILLDFNLPNGRGDYVLRRLKRNPVTRDIPVIVVTGVRDQKLEREMLQLGAAGFFTKPLDFQQLRDELEKHIDILVTP
jgi:CheY-like chemotaxis protein